MNRIVRGMLVAGVAATVAAGSVSAQARGYIGFGGGVSIPTGEFGDVAKTGWMGQVVAGITGPTGKLGGRVNGTYIHHGSDFDDDDSVRLLGAMGDVVFSPGVPDAKLRPFLLGGLGFQNAKANTTGAEGETNFAFNFGGGVNIGMGRAKLFIEGRWLRIQTEGESTSLIPLSVGVRFGGN
jgi:hypothetical protein